MTTTKRAPVAAKKKTDPVKDDFHYMVGEVEVVLPSLGYLKPGLVRKVRRLGDIDAMYTLFEMILDEDTLAAVDDMDPEEYAAMLEAWRDHSGVSLGES